MKAHLILGLALVLFLSAACVSSPQVVPTPPTVPAPVGQDGWRTYTNPLGFAIRYPAASWSQEELPQQAGDTFQTVVVQGPEGEVDLHWGVGFGGACPQGYTTVTVAEGELPACYVNNSDGTEAWTQINKELSTTSFSAEARTLNSDLASRDLVLEVLSTLSFASSGTTLAGAEQGATKLTARMLTAPNALAGPSPSSLTWSPVGAALAYVEPQDDQDVLWLYDTTGDKQVLLNPAESPGTIDVTTAQWSPQGDRLLLAGDEALWLLDVATGDLSSLGEGGSAITSMMFTPDGLRVSYVQDNDLYVAGIDDGEVQRLTTDGGETVFNGALDWVYNEELATRAAQPAYAWSPDGNWLIYLRLDESAVHSDPVTDYRPVPATVSYTRYPTAGTANPVASLHALTPGALAPPLELALAGDAEYVLPFFTWTPDSNHALYITVNRDHTKLALNMWTPQSGETRTLITEEDPYWINEERYAAPVFIGDGSQFIWVSERDGFMHLYLYAQDGTLVKQLTQGEWMIDSSAWDLLTAGRPVHVDPAGASAYFITTQASPLERQIYRLDIASGDLEQLTQEPGFHLFALSGDGQYLVEQFSDVDTPTITKIVKTGDGSATVLSEAAGPALDLPGLTREFVTVKAQDGTDLYAQLVKPENFDPSQKYPVVVHWYGGPGLQMVSDRYGTTNIFNIIERDVLYTQEGFLVWRLDNRGSFGRGHAFETPIFGELGKAALDDQLAGIDYLKTLPYVDATRIGTDGKSFGGYMTLYALLHAPDVFRCGVAGAAPTDWSYYDTIYTERYMRTPDKNPDGYAATNLIDLAGQIQARPLLIHGLADTNVHLQNTVNFIQALEANDKLFDFIPLPNLSHSFKGDGLVAALSASADYLGACLAAAPAAPAGTAAEPAAAGSEQPEPAPAASATVTTALPYETGATLQPLSKQTCAELAQAMGTTLDVEVTQSEAPFTDPSTGETGMGCQATATGTGEQFTSPDAVVNALTDMLEAQGWQEDPMLAAGGPTGIGVGYRKDNQVCLAGAIWQPDASANCPTDQPISACAVTPEQQLYTVTFNCAQSTAGLANPASVNCAEQGGTLSIEERGDGGQVGVCYFEDNRQCEEWALLRGDCPVGGVKVTGDATTAVPATPQEPETTAVVTTPVTATTTSTATKVPLKDAIASLEPQAVWQNFYDLTQVPRPSHHEEQVAAFLVQFGQDLGLETIVDDAGNVLIRKPASPGLENVQGVILQAHMDMVPQKTPESGHDFLTDSIDAYIDGEFVMADGTTLGADDGIGMAMAMAILQAAEPPLGPIEALFTVNEEDGMDGALGLQADLLQGSILINLDSEAEGEFTIGSAGGEYVAIDTAYAEAPVPEAMSAYSVTVSGLQGGHSGVDIAKGRGHATKLLVRLLSPAAQQYGVRLASIAGGDASNAITREATALVVLPTDQVDAFLQYVQQFDAIIKSELSAVEPNVSAQATPADLPAQVMDETGQRLLLDALYATPQGVLRMSDAVPGLVETSTNIGIVDAAEGKLFVSLLPRSSVDTALDDVGQMIASVWDMASVEVEVSGRYSGWKPNPESPIVLLMQAVYREQTGQDAVVTAIHAGLECGTIVAKYPGMDAISIGPTLHDVHTPRERLEIATVPKLVDLLLKTLQRIPAKSLADSGQPPATQEAATAVEETPAAAITMTQVIIYVPGLPTGEPQAGSCWTNSLAVWRADAWRCFVANEIYDPCFDVGEYGSVVCGADPAASTTSFVLTLTDPLPAPRVPQDTVGHAWQVELADGIVCGYATGATGGVGDERINYFCPSPDSDQQVVILGDLQPGVVWMAKRAVLSGSMPDLTVLESAEVPLRAVWR